MISKILRRFGLIGEDKLVLANTRKLRQRQQNQLSLLEPLKKNVDKSLLNMKLTELETIKNEKVFNTFATRCLNPEIQSLNALADVNVERVLEKQAHQKIPFTVKDHLKVDGMVTTCSFADNIQPASENSDVVHFLEKEGCIAFAHSNVPQGLLGIESGSSLYGLSKNPHNPEFISGGSSGGEGALVASKACAFGIGSDSGGSARIPAAFCGVYGFKPTGSKRLSIKGRVNPRGIEGVKIGDLDPSFGFMTRNMDDLAWICQKTIGKTTQSLPYLYGGEWDQSRYQASKRKKLRVGYIYTNHEMKVAPGIVNSIDQTLQALRNQKHKVVQFDFPKLDLFRDFFFQFAYQSGFLTGIGQRMKGHHPTSQVAHLYDVLTFGRLGSMLQKNKSSDHFIKHIFNLYTKERSTKHFIRIHSEVDKLKKEFMKEWNQKNIDVLVSPVMPFTAMLPGISDVLIYQLSYSCYQNTLELPAGVIPTRLVKESETQYKPTNVYERKIASSIHRSKGMPIAIQVTGKHLADQQCLGAMWTISNLVGHYIDPQLPKP